MAGLVRLIRQICLLREKGERNRADRLEQNELAEAVRDFRAGEGPQSLPECVLNGIFATEAERVADAAAMVELLVPHIREALALPGAAPVKPATGRVVVSAGPSVARTSPPADPLSIPDLLDAMLALERKGGR